jgi:signal peptidase I
MGGGGKHDRRRFENAARTAAAGRPAAEARADGDTVWNPFPGWIETIESIVVAFTLALLFRGFEAEAFVIPTGSMAPTLMGRHKDLACAACGRDFRVGCSTEEDEQSQSLRTELARLEREAATLGRAVADATSAPRDREAARRRLELLESDRGPLAELRARLTSKMVPAARCPNCGFVTELMENKPGKGRVYKWDYPSFSGDRILVDKFAFDFASPDRWDVVVFRYPEDAKTNYIKRLVGLPNETVHISGGDLWTSRADERPVIARKPPEKLRAMLQCVHDSRHVAPRLLAAGWPLCWADWSAQREAAACRWTTADEGRSWTAACAAGGTARLRYRHLVPTAEDWTAVEAGQPLAERAKATRIDDFQPYNAIATRPHPVGDLAVECRLESRRASGTVALDLVEDGRRHQCLLDLATGTARLESPTLAAAATAATPVRGSGRWDVLFANVDDELTLFVNGRRIAFEGPTTWDAPMGPREAPVERAVPEPGDTVANDLAPAGIEAVDADVTVSGLRVLRDIHYITAVDVARNGQIIEEPVLDFPLGPDQFLVLGDNSAASKDSRLWLEGHHVDRSLLIGRALVIFWPHAIPAKWGIPVKLGGWEVRLPCWPNFGRMTFVR